LTEDTRSSKLARVLAAREFAVAVEISPPVGPNKAALLRQAERVKGFADAYNVTDNQSARIHLASLPACILIQEAGLEPVVQFTCRDRNRLGLQADLLGAATFGIPNVLALSGDHPVCGDHPHVRSVGDIDSINLLRMIRMMRDDQVFENGQPIPKIAPQFFIGAVANPFAPPHDFRPLRLAKKIAAGAQFIQTQLVYNVDRFRDYMHQVVDLGLHEKAAILAGVGPVKSLAGLEFMRTQVAGMDVPESLLGRFRGLSKEDQQKAGLDLACEIGEQLRAIEGVRGLHVMAIGATTMIPELVRRLGLYPRPVA
jgi:methylenetetrahydrofolate reductase (NADPH)